MDGFWRNFCLFLQVRWFNFKDLIKTIVCFWIPHPHFALVDLTLLLSYFFKSPYRIVKSFTHGEEPYGETPLSVMNQIVKRAKVTSEDTVFELGSGRGRACFWLAQIIGCKTVGIENVPTFVHIAKRIQKWFSVPNVTFVLGDLFDADYSKATVLYLFGTCLSDEDVLRFIEKIKGLSGRTVITISYALTEYSTESQIQLVDTFDVHFPWGITQCYIHKIV